MTQNSTTSPSTPTRRPTGALACCAVATIAVTLLTLLVTAGALAWLQSGGTEADRAMGTLLVVIGVVFLGVPTVLMWVALIRLLTQPPRGAALMIGCLRAVGGFVLVVAVPAVSRGGSVAVMGTVGCVGLAFLGAAQLLAAATRVA